MPVKGRLVVCGILLPHYYLRLRMGFSAGVPMARNFDGLSKNLFGELYGCGIAHHRSVGLLGDGIVSVPRAESILVHSECAVSCLCIRLQMAE